MSYVVLLSDTMAGIIHNVYQFGLVAGSLVTSSRDPDGLVMSSRDAGRCVNK